ncbi:MAG: hypothetical protein GY789_27245, partial [Hyphomicrobiales bacterium]|nr:hypothetical protein [Hyphomicrobiales bacterium]
MPDPTVQRRHVRTTAPHRARPESKKETATVAARSPEDPRPERLQKVLSRAGLGSRRVCDDLIADGRVQVNGDIAELGRRVDPESDTVEVDGVRIGVRQGLRYLLLNKPAGVVTT